MEEYFKNQFPLHRFPMFVFFSLCTVLLLTVSVYYPGLSGSFLLDDINTLRTLNRYGGVTDGTSLKHFVFSLSTSLVGRPVSMLSFLLNDQFFPGDPASYKYTNVMLHLLNGFLLVFIIYKMLHIYRGEQKSNYYIAISVAAIWLLHPYNVSTTLYIIQRMTQLVTLFSLLSIALYCTGRANLEENPGRSLWFMTFAMFPFGMLAVLSKETGVLLLFFLLTLEFTLFSKINRPAKFKIWYLVFVIVPAVIFVLFMLSRLDIYLPGFEARDFTLYERVLTESRILLIYLYNIIIPQASNTGLFHDDIVISTGLFTPASTFFSILSILGLLAASIAFRKKHPVLSFGILWFFTGHVLESTIIPLELYFEHRNYLPMLGPLLACVYYLFHFAQKVPHKIAKYSLTATPVIVALICAVFTYQLSTLWGNTNQMYKTWYEEHPTSLRAASMYGATLLDSQPDLAFSILTDTFNRNQHAIVLPILMLEVACKKNLQPPFSIEKITMASERARYSGALSSVMTRLFETKVRGKCDLFDYREFELLLSSLLENTKNMYLGTRVELLKMLSDLHILQRNLSPAVETLDEAFKLMNLPEIAARQANILASAGLYEEAINYIGKAKVADANRRAFVPSILPDLLYLENRYKLKLQR